jgi:hypothetical protein
MACCTAARLLCCAVASLASWTGVGSAAAQSDACILSPDKNNPNEQILRCGAELTITPAPGTVYHPAAAGEDGLPPSVQLDSGALLIEFHAKDTAKLRHDFQILTPQVVASVHGTKWMMEVKPGQTSAVVLLGQGGHGRPGPGRRRRRRRSRQDDQIEERQQRTGADRGQAMGTRPGQGAAGAVWSMIANRVRRRGAAPVSRPGWKFAPPVPTSMAAVSPPPAFGALRCPRP